MKLSNRIEREKRAVGIMIKMYCDHNHDKINTVCYDCNELTDFANERINR